MAVTPHDLNRYILGSVIFCGYAIAAKLAEREIDERDAHQELVHHAESLEAAPVWDADEFEAFREVVIREIKISDESFASTLDRLKGLLVALSP